MYKHQARILYMPSLGQNIIWGLGALAATFLFLYGYFVLNTILNIVERERLETQVIAASAEFAGLEARYLDTERRITMEFANTLGFHEVQNSRYVTRTGLALTPRSR